MAVGAKEYTTRPDNNTPRGMYMTSIERHEARYQRRKAKRDEKRRAFIDKYDNFDRVSSPSALIRAHWEARKGVMWKASPVRYDMHFFRNALRIHADMQKGRDTRQGFYAFTVWERGKMRSIHSLHYAERVIRRSVCINSTVPIFSHNLIHDNGASLKGLGVSFSIRRCEEQLHRIWREGAKDGYVLMVDFKRYFDNISHPQLFDIYDRYIHDPRLNALCKGFVTATGERGLYIGPEDSQISAVAYPNVIDHCIKDRWGVKQYGRYMDDSSLIAHGKETVIGYRDGLYKLYEEMGIVVNTKKTQIIKLSRGFTFLKTQFFILDNGRLIEKPDHDNIVRQRRKLKAFRRFVSEGVMTVRDVCSAYMSWRGYILTKNAHWTVVQMDALVYRLFAVRPWKKRKDDRYGRTRTDQRRNQCSQKPARTNRLPALQGD